MDESCLCATCSSVGAGTQGAVEFEVTMKGLKALAKEDKSRDVAKEDEGPLG